MSCYDVWGHPSHERLMAFSGLFDIKANDLLKKAIFVNNVKFLFCCQDWYVATQPLYVFTVKRPKKAIKPL